MEDKYNNIILFQQQQQYIITLHYKVMNVAGYIITVYINKIIKIIYGSSRYIFMKIILYAALYSRRTRFRVLRRLT